MREVLVDNEEEEIGEEDDDAPFSCLDGAVENATTCVGNEAIATTATRQGRIVRRIILFGMFRDRVRRELATG